ncbi:hypothetical protein ANACAC_00663 [Anaerostipes caccae L1-92]|uniref:Uncharacterized protein n=1 Tax=Anaerostipes caccae (strain DSM 14662 / CCUG 47493 / JCM 13470 / NCIMB 13811 / L1-92) TaxID=411490 RepID=B0MAT8_ANACD|nr:hypothetical protein ANACAC_00663 [Anaerostipes caccae L1-92]
MVLITFYLLSILFGLSEKHPPYTAPSLFLFIVLYYYILFFIVFQYIIRKERLF